MMRRYLRFFSLAAFMVPTIGSADVREMSQSDLRHAVSTLGAISTSRLVDGVENFSGGRVVEVRGFDVDGALTYRVLVRHDDGHLGALLVDGVSGHAVAPDTSVGRRVSSAASSTAANNDQLARSPGSGNSGRVGSIGNSSTNSAGLRNGDSTKSTLSRNNGRGDHSDVAKNDRGSRSSGDTGNKDGGSSGNRSGRGSAN
ncbi:hypothetical protein [Yoonia sp. SS1-5]|uniref:PepSY domain-containing protein n=1 Tax=Yoonia rhodophyticola TaxID=3137370 RepID=A0AAN0MAA7_9RHOB